MLAFARAVAIEAGRAMAAAFRRPLPGGVDHKGRRDLVTEVDRSIERLIAARILARFPDDAIVAEENIRRPGTSGRVWMVDPLDGTTNFVHGHPMVAVSIALAEGYVGPPDANALADDPRASGFFDPRNLPRVRLGVVAAPILNEIYYAERGVGAWRCVIADAMRRGTDLNATDLDAGELERAERLRVTRTDRLEDAFCATGFAYRMNELTNDNVGNFAKMSLRVQAIRRGGSAALDLCYVAAGHFDAFWELYLKPWDVAAGSLLIEEAGGRITGFDDEPCALEGVEVLATNGRLHDSVRAVLDKPDPQWAAVERAKLAPPGSR